MPRYGSGGPITAGSRPRLRNTRRWPLRLLVVLLILAALLEGADVLARHVAEDTIASRAVRATGASSASSQISGWPVLYDFFVRNSLRSVSVQLQDVPIRSGPVKLTVQEVDVVLTGVGVSAGDLVAHRSLRLTGISSATVRAVVNEGELSDAVGATVKILPGGRIGIKTPTGLVSATVAVDGGVLTIDAAGRQVLRVDLAEARLIPDCSMTTSVSGSQLTASCSVAPVPPSVLAALSGPA